MKFVVAGFNRDEEDLQVGEELQQMLNEYGGTVVVKRFRGIPDYGIVPIEGAQLPCTVGEVVTHLWLQVCDNIDAKTKLELVTSESNQEDVNEGKRKRKREDCHDQDKVVPVEYYHRPLSLEPECRPLQGCEVFSKKDNPEKNAVASTHLICPTPEGNKFAAAVKWGIPAVTKDWLLSCAQKRQKVPEHDYAVTYTSANVVPSTPASMSVSTTISKETTVLKKILPLGDENENSNQKPSASCSETEGERISAVQIVQNENEETERTQNSGVKTPCIARMLSYSCEKSLEEQKEEVSVKGLPVPAPKVDELRKERSFAGYNFTPPSSAGNVSIGSIKRGLDFGNVSARNLECGDPEESFGKKVKGSQDMTPGTPYGCIFEADPSNSTKKAWKKWVDEPTEKNPRRAKPLHSVIAYIWKELPQKQREELSIKIDSLGGTVLNSYSDSITHAIFLGEESENFSEYKAAKKAGKILVAPAWVEFCATEGEHKDEALFPPSDYKLGDILGPGVKWESLKSGKNAALQKLSVLKTVEDESNSLQKKNSLEGVKEPFREPEVQMQLRKLDHILAEEKVSPMERVRKTRLSCSGLREDRLSSPRYSNSPSSRNCANPPSPNTQGSANEVVSWQENPISEEVMRKMVERKANDEQDTQISIN
ncbi:hypothetical protein J437_LFUL004556 [Ladona fulva]|uniref:BRCT domain-containing protein n=1 Tax=Ladona fulva TaxID=123851 RepID=A0A8K0JTR3_LADFU|nr:hypothetical protein J437_LFUL004556 [Ladona fulva]